MTSPVGHWAKEHLKLSLSPSGISRRLIWAGVSERGGVGGSVPWTGSARNGMPAGRPYVWRRQGPVVARPDHPGQVLCALPGGGARGICPVDGASYQMDAPEA